MSAHYLLEWQFSPADSFEARRTVSAPKWKAVIESGRIELRIEASDYPADHSLRHSLQHELDCRFKALQVLNHRKYTLTGPRAVFVDADGRKHYRTFADCGGFAAVGASVDLIARDPDGNVVRNTKQERIS